MKSRADDGFTYSEPWSNLGISQAEWDDLSVWCDEFFGEHLSKHEVYAVGGSTLGYLFILKLRTKALVRATRLVPALHHLATRLSGLVSRIVPIVTRGRRAW